MKIKDGPLPMLFAVEIVTYFQIDEIKDHFFRNLHCFTIQLLRTASIRKKRKHWHCENLCNAL